jgi:ADP-ribose pyrophosphatase
MKFDLLHSEIIFKGRVFTIRRDQLRTPDGGKTAFDIVEHHGSVVILPVDHEGNLLFVRQYRHAAQLDLLELPAGTLDNAQETPLHCAAREIREETGMAAKNLLELGKFYLAPGYSTELMTVFLATDLYPSPLQPDADEFLELEKIPVNKALAMAEAGQMPDAKTLAALLLAKPHLRSDLKE